MLQSILHSDKEIFLVLNGIHNNFFDVLFLWISKSISWIPLHILIIYMLFKKFRSKTALFILLFGVVLITLSDQISTNLVKETVKRLRPCHDDEIGQFVHIVANHCGGKYGFFSSHASNYFALATFFSLIFRNKVFTSVAFFLAATIAYSRIYLGVHYPLDVFCGAIFGTFLAYLIFKLLKKYSSVEL